MGYCSSGGWLNSSCSRKRIKGNQGHPRATAWRLHTKLHKFGWSTFSNNPRMNSRKDLTLGEVVYISITFHIQASWLNLLNGHDFIFDGVTLQTSHMRQLVNLGERIAPKNKQRLLSRFVMALYPCHFFRNNNLIRSNILYVLSFLGISLLQLACFVNQLCLF